MTNLKDKFLLIWVYFGEIIAASLIYGFFFILYEPNDILLFIIKVSEHIVSKFVYLMLTASIGFYWVFYKESSSEFAKWLYRNNSYEIYSKSFLSTIAIYFITLVIFSITDITKNIIATYLTGFMLILSLVNIFTFFNNVKELAKLSTYFYTKLEEEKNKTS